MRNRYLTFAIICVLAIQSVSLAYPKPSLVHDKGEWTLDVRYSQPQQISVKVPSDPAGKEKRFWYIILTVTNNTGQDAPFYPSFYLVTDTFKVIPAEKRMRKVVFDQIKLINHARYPFLESLDFVGNKVLQGKDNERDIAVIWPDFDPKAKNVDMFFAGLSNEIALIDHPINRNAKGEPAKVYLAKALQLKYSIGGDERLRAYAKLQAKSRHWVMR